MKRLLLLRHAKAVREGADDHLRALEKRGEADSVRVGRFLRDEEYLPDLVLCSTATRTRRTLELVLHEIGKGPQIRFVSELYLAEPELILALIRRVPDSAASLMIVGHNPGLEQCALALARLPDERKPRKRYAAMEEKFPTGALAVIDFDLPKWADVGPGPGELIAFVRPKDLDAPD